MNGELWKSVDRYYKDLILPRDERFDRIEESVREAGMPEIAISAPYGHLMEILIKTARIRRVLEIGTLGGYSTAWLARGLPQGGSLISLEIDPERAVLARKNLEAFQFEAQIEIRVGSALQLMEEMAENDLDPFDLIFIDGDKSQYPEYLELSLQLCQPGTLIIADNVVKHGPVFNQEITTPSQKGITKFHQLVAASPQLEGSVIQTVGQKGHDGLAFIRVKETIN